VIRELKNIARVDNVDLRKDDPHLLTFINVNTEDELEKAEGYL
jgi:molybdopterin-guanine dinucleotide biosynthesis protein A